MSYGNGTAVTSVSQSYTYDTNYNFTAYSTLCSNASVTPATSYYNWSFYGWSTSSSSVDSSRSYTDGQSFSNLTSTNGGTITLYSKLSRTPTITFNANKPSRASSNVSGSMNGMTASTQYRGASSSSTSTSSVSVTLNSNNYSLTGWTFQGWSTSSTATSASYANGASFLWAYNTTKDVTLYAVWSPKTYSVNFYVPINSNSSNINNGSTYIKEYTLTATADSNFSLNVFDVAGYDFDGWLYSNAPVNGTFSKDDAGITLYSAPYTFKWQHFDSADDNYYFYGVYSPKRLKVNYFTTFNNDANQVNNTRFYNSLDLPTGQTYVVFNDILNLFDISNDPSTKTTPNGYKFIGWLFFDAPQTSGTILNVDGTNSISIDTYDSLGGTYVNKTPLTPSNVTFKFNGDVYAYAVYEPYNFKIRYFVPNFGDIDLLANNFLQNGLINRLPSTADEYENLLNLVWTYSISECYDDDVLFNSYFTAHDVTSNKFAGTTLRGWVVARTDIYGLCNSDGSLKPVSARDQSIRLYNDDVVWQPGQEIYLNAYESAEDSVVYYAYAVYELSIYKIHYYTAIGDSSNISNLNNLSSSTYEEHLISGMILFGSNYTFLRYEDDTLEHRIFNYFFNGMHIEKWMVTPNSVDKYTSTVVLDGENLPPDLIYEIAGGERQLVFYQSDWFRSDAVRSEEDGFYHYYAYAWYDYTDYFVHYYEITDEEFNYDRDNVNSFIDPSQIDLAKFIDGRYNYSENESLMDTVTWEVNDYVYRDGSLIKAPKGYVFDKWVIYYISDLDKQTYILSENDYQGVWNYTYNIYCFAQYKPKTYNVNYYIADNNLVQTPNTTGDYSHALTVPAIFNDNFVVKNFNLLGLTLVGFIVDDGNLPIRLSLDDITNKGNFDFDNLAVSNGLYSNSEIWQNWLTENNFKFRYDSDINVYAIYEQNSITINYYEPVNNVTANMANTDFGNYSLKGSETTLFNGNYNVLEATSVTGYKFAGWLVYISYTVGEINEFTSTHLLKIQVNAENSMLPGYVSSMEYYDDEIVGYLQDWASGNNFTFRYTDTVYAFAYYTPIEYSLYFYDANSNTEDANNSIDINNAANYSQRGIEFKFAFNDKFTVTADVLEKLFNYNYSFNYTGYDFIGFNVSTTPINSAFTSFTTEYRNSLWVNDFSSLNNILTNENDSAIASTDFEQKWEVGNTFDYRYTQAIYIYAVYSKVTYNVNYFVANTFVYGSPNVIANYHQIEDVDDVFAYATFNNRFSPLSNISLSGYNFAGWLVFGAQQTDGTISKFTSDYLISYDITGSPNLRNIVSDEPLGYLQDWSAGNDFMFRYTGDVYAYAYYTPKEYKLSFYYADYDKNLLFNGTSHLDNPTGNYDEQFGVNTNYVKFTTITVKFNEPLDLVYENFNLNLPGFETYLPHGYDFYYWILSRDENASHEKLYNFPIYNNGHVYFSEEFDQTESSIISYQPDEYVYGDFGSEYNYIFESFLANDGSANRITMHWDLFEHEEYFFYAYYRKQIYEYNYFGSLTNENANNFANYEKLNEDGEFVVKYDNIITLENLYRNALPTNFAFMGWYISDKAINVQVLPKYDENSNLLYFYYTNESGNEVKIQLVNDILFEGYELGRYVDLNTYQPYANSQVNGDRYIYAIYRQVINKYNVDVKASNGVSEKTADGRFDYLNDSVYGYLQNMLFSGVNSVGSIISDLSIISGSLYNTDIFINNSQTVSANTIHSIQNLSLTLKFTCSVGYRLGSFDIKNAFGASLIKRSVRLYDGSTIQTNIVKITETEIAESQFGYVIEITNLFNSDTANYYNSSTAYADDICDLVFNFEQASYKFFNFSQTGSTNKAAEGYSYVPKAANGSVSSSQTFDIVSKTAGQNAYYGNTNAVVFYPKFSALSTDSSLFEISSFLKSIKIGDNTYTFVDGYNSSTRRFDMSMVTSDEASSYTSAYQNFTVGQITYDVVNAFKLGDYVLYLCSRNAQSDMGYDGNSNENAYCYILFGDSCKTNNNKTLVANFENISNKIVTNASLSNANDVYTENNNFGTITNTISNVLPTATQTITISQLSGYVIDYVLIGYQGYEYRIDLSSIVTNYQLGGKYNYTYTYTDSVNDNTFYLINNNLYISYKYDASTATVTISITGIYHETTVSAFFKSHVVVRFEAEKLSYLSNALTLETVDKTNLKFSLGDDILAVIASDGIVAGKYDGVNKLGENAEMIFIEISVYGNAQLFAKRDANFKDNSFEISLLGDYYSFRLENSYIYGSNSEIDITDVAYSTTNYMISYIKPMQDIFAINGNGRSFVKFRIDVLSNELDVESYLNVTDTDGKILGTRLDPYSKNTWFNGQILSKINVNYSSNFEDNKFDIEEYSGADTFIYYGKTIVFDYAKIPGYSLTQIRFYGNVNNTLTEQNDYQAVNITATVSGGVVTFIDSCGNETLASYIFDADSNKYVFTFSGDIVAYLTGGFKIEFYSTPDIFTVTYNSNKHSSSSALFVNGTDRGNVDDVTVQKFVYNQVPEYSDINVTSNVNKLDSYPFYMVGYTFIGWSNVTDWTDTTDSVTLFADESSFVSNVSGTNSYTYNYYELLKEQILAGNVNLYARWQVETYRVYFNLNDTTQSTPSRFFNKESDLYNATSQLYAVDIVFDTFVWNNIEDVLASRYGYSWNGWFATADGRLCIIAGTERDEKVNLNVQKLFDYSLYTQLVELGALPKDLGTRTQANLLGETPDHKVQLYAKWTANEYNVHYYYAVATYNEEDLVNSINNDKLVQSLGHSVEAIGNFLLWKTETHVFDSDFVVSVKYNTELDGISDPMHYEFYTWFRWYNNYDNPNQETNPDYEYNANWYNNYASSKWYNPNVPTSDFDGLCDVPYMSVAEKDGEFDESEINKDLISTDKFIKPETVLNKNFAGDEYFFGYCVKEIYYASFFDTDQNPETVYDANGVDVGHHFITPSNGNNPDYGKNYIYLNTNYTDKNINSKGNMLRTKYANSLSWSWDPFAEKCATDSSFTQQLLVPSWYEFVGWYVQLDNNHNYIINDYHYLNDYFTSTNNGNQSCHVFTYSYTLPDGSTDTATSEFYYYTDTDGQVKFRFTHVYSDIYVYAVYKMVEYEASIDINADYGATEYVNSNVNVFNTNSVIYANNTSYIGSYKDNLTFPEYVDVAGADEYSYIPSLFTPNSYPGRDLFNGFAYNKDESLTTTVVQNNNFTFFLYLNEGYELLFENVKITNNGQTTNIYNKDSFISHYDEATRKYTYEIRVGNIYSDFKLTIKVTSIKLNSISHSTTGNSNGSQGYVSAGTAESGVFDLQTINSNASGLFVGNTQYVVFYPKQADKSYTSEFETSLSHTFVDSYIKTLQISNGKNSVIYSFEYGLDSNGYEIDYSNFVLKDENGNVVQLETANIPNIFMVGNNGIGYNVEQAYTLELDGIKYVIYLCHNIDGTLDDYCYVLFADVRNENSGLKVVANFEDITNTVKFDSNLVESNDIYDGKSSVGATIDYKDSLTQTGILPSSTYTYVIRPHSGYIINNVTLKYGNGSFVISRDSISSVISNGIYSFNYKFSDNVNDDWVFLFRGNEFISYSFDEKTGNIEIKLFGIYGDVEISVEAESFVSIRFESEQPSALTTVSDIKLVTKETFKLGLYQGIIALDKLPTNILDLISNLDVVGDSYVLNGKTIYFVEFSVIGNASLFDNGITLRVVGDNFTYRMTDFKVANKQTTLAAGSCYTVNSDDSTVNGAISADSRYKLIYISDITKLSANSVNDNNTFGGYNFARVLVEETSTNVSVESYFYTLGNNGSISGTNLDPVASGSWFNGQILSDIVLSYYNINNASNFITSDYKSTLTGIISETFYGNEYFIKFAEIEGYSLTMISYLGQNYYISYELEGSNYVVKVKNASGVAIALPSSLSITYQKTSENYGTFTFSVKADL